MQVSFDFWLDISLAQESCPCFRVEFTMLVEVILPKYQRLIVPLTNCAFADEGQRWQQRRTTARPTTSPIRSPTSPSRSPTFSTARFRNLQADTEAFWEPPFSGSASESFTCSHPFGRPASDGLAAGLWTFPGISARPTPAAVRSTPASARSTAAGPKLAQPTPARSTPAWTSPPRESGGAESDGGGNLRAGGVARRPLSAAASGDWGPGGDSGAVVSSPRPLSAPAAGMHLCWVN